GKLVAGRDGLVRVVGERDQGPEERAPLDASEDRDFDRVRRAGNALADDSRALGDRGLFREYRRGDGQENSDGDRDKALTVHECFSPFRGLVDTRAIPRGSESSKTRSMSPFRGADPRM